MKLMIELPDDAYNKLKERNCDGWLTSKEIEYMHKAIVNGTPLEEELENQKPMQIELEADGYADGELVYDYGKCPKCGWDFEDGDKDWEEPYCCHCGQRLHWFDMKEENNV